MRKKSIRFVNLKVAAGFPKEGSRWRRDRSALDWVEQWQQDEEVEAVYLDIQEFGYKGEQKNEAGTETA